MNKDKIKEAIRDLKAVHKMYDVMCGDWSFCWTAIEALEKQIPKKPTNDSFYYHCPICNGIVYKGRGCANNECRQAIDWSEDNE